MLLSTLVIFTFNLPVCISFSVYCVPSTSLWHFTVANESSGPTASHTRGIFFQEPYADVPSHVLHVAGLVCLLQGKT